MSVNENEDQYLEIGMGSKEEYLKHLDIDHELGKALNYWDAVKGEITANALYDHNTKKYFCLVIDKTIKMNFNLFGFLI
jgi:hypothetical protein